MYPLGSVLAVVMTIWIGVATQGCPLPEHPIGGVLSFVKEVSSTEIARQGEDKILDCAAANFCEITWYKDGAPLAGQQLGGGAELPYLQDKNQYLVFKDVDVTDGGEYACLVSNGKEQIRRNTRFVVLGKSYTGAPIFLGGDGEETCGDQTADLGGSLRLACAFFVGEDSLSRSSAGWLRVIQERDVPMEFLPVEATSQQGYRDNDVIIARLHIERIGKDDFGTWKVYVENGIPTEVEVRVDRRPPADNSTSSGASVPGSESVLRSGEPGGCSEGLRATIAWLAALLVLTSSLLVITLAVFLWWASARRNHPTSATDDSDPVDTKSVSEMKA